MFSKKYLINLKLYSNKRFVFAITISVIIHILVWIYLVFWDYYFFISSFDDLKISCKNVELLVNYNTSIDEGSKKVNKTIYSKKAINIESDIIRNTSLKNNNKVTKKQEKKKKKNTVDENIKNQNISSQSTTTSSTTTNSTTSNTKSSPISSSTNSNNSNKSSLLPNADISEIISKRKNLEIGGAKKHFQNLAKSFKDGKLLLSEKELHSTMSSKLSKDGKLSIPSTIVSSGIDIVDNAIKNSLIEIGNPINQNALKILSNSLEEIKIELKISSTAIKSYISLKLKDASISESYVDKLKKIITLAKLTNRNKPDTMFLLNNMKLYSKSDMMIVELNGGTEQIISFLLKGTKKK